MVQGITRTSGDVGKLHHMIIVGFVCLFVFFVCLLHELIELLSVILILLTVVVILSEVKTEKVAAPEITQTLLTFDGDQPEDKDVVLTEAIM